jgi:hypothetical protein
MGKKENMGYKERRRKGERQKEKQKEEMWDDMKKNMGARGSIVG